MASNSKYSDSMEPNQSSGNWKKKKRKGKALVYGAKNYYSVVEHEQWDNQEKKKTVSSV